MSNGDIVEWSENMLETLDGDRNPTIDCFELPEVETFPDEWDGFGMWSVPKDKVDWPKEGF